MPQVHPSHRALALRRFSELCCGNSFCMRVRCADMDLGMGNTAIGVIGGSGLYAMEGLTETREQQIETPFGAPSGPVVTGCLDGVPVAFLARHGQGHRLIPSEVPYRANVYALKALGVRYLLSVSAVGSLREDVAP